MTSTTFFIIFIPILAILLLAINLILAPHNPYQEKDSTFECGFHSFLGQNRTQFSVSFFIFALLFLLFDLEILLVYPYSVSTYTNDSYGLSVMMAFFVLLTLGFVFELGKNALTIDSRQTSNYGKVDSSETHAFLTSSFSMSGKYLIGLAIAIFISLMVYVVRIVLMIYLDMDVFSLSSVLVSLTYFCSFSGIGYLVKEYLNNHFFTMYHTTGVNSSLNITNLEKDNIYSKMNAPSTGDDTTSTRTRATLESEISSSKDELEYWKFQQSDASSQFKNHLLLRPRYEQLGKLAEFEKQKALLDDTLKDCSRNVSTEYSTLVRLQEKLQKNEYTPLKPTSPLGSALGKRVGENDMSEASNKRSR
uniref:NADH-ubiquinone oxidoreductase chain 3 n=1 Tax=Peyronellaea pinodes TaxID=749589 RepID=A0A109QMB1_PEYPI|nr:NADH dehydrogenase subunit 3 [Didymella pinodes]AMB20890.1 NADH dehydrogenase subunit 3 [Didymella pinodes]